MEKEKMIFYHASKIDLPIGGSLHTPTGHSEMNVTTGGVVYLTSTIEACKKYGSVYEIEVTKAISYKEQLRLQGRTKKAKFTKNVFVALPENTKIIKKIR